MLFLPTQLLKVYVFAFELAETHGVVSLLGLLHFLFLVALSQGLKQLVVLPFICVSLRWAVLSDLGERGAPVFVLEGDVAVWGALIPEELVLLVFAFLKFHFEFVDHLFEHLQFLVCRVVAIAILIGLPVDIVLLVLLESVF